MACNVVLNSIKMGEERWFGKKYNGSPTDSKKRGAKKNGQHE